MRIVCPYVEIDPRTADLLNTYPEVEKFFVGASDDSYFQVLSQLWSDGEGFCIVEHDVWCGPVELRDFIDCPHAWCGAKTPYLGGTHDGLGLVKFSSEVLAQVPDALDQVAQIFDSTHPPKHWCRLDAWLQTRVLPGAGLTKHVHDLVTGHAHDGPSHGCIKEV